MPSINQLIIDTDPGVDDAIAILMALAGSGSDDGNRHVAEVVGMTTVGGNVPLARATRNTLALLDYTGRGEIPVSPGSSRPLKGTFPYAYGFHGKGGLSRRLPEPQTRPVGHPAVHFLASRLKEHAGKITLVALGPLTNLAKLERQYPGLLQQVESLVVMGGAVDTAGNVTPHAEFNFYSDPLAAHEVASCGAPLLLVDLGACRQVFLDRHTADQMKGKSPLGRLAVQLLRNWFRQHPQRDRFEFYDPLALAAAMKPDLFQTRRVRLDVEIEDPVQMGNTRVTGEGGEVAVVERLDERKFFALMGELLVIEGIEIP